MRRSCPTAKRSFFPIIATFWGMSPVAWSALAEWCALGLAVAVGVVALGQLLEARRLRNDQTRPYVVAFAEPSPAAFAVIDLVIKNFGRTAARDVQVQFEPTVRRASGSEPKEAVQLPAVLPVLVP
jgi:hypothetical protein